VWRGLPVAVKSVEFVDAPFEGNPMERAVAEASIAYNLHHPNLVNTFDTRMLRKGYSTRPGDRCCANAFRMLLIQVRGVRGWELSRTVQESGVVAL